MGTSSKALARVLRKVALRQHGCFTAAQALDAGYADSVHLYHVKNGEWIRVFRGIYRLAEVPETPAGRCMAALLWTRDKSGKIQGSLAPETQTALEAGTLDPARPIRVGVPKGFRRSSPPPDGIVVSVENNKNHKTSNISSSPAPKPGLPTIPPAMDAADYYDWLDYQDSICTSPSSAS